MKKHVSLFLALVLTLSILSSFALAEDVPGVTYNGQDVSEPVELVLYYLGDTYPDQDMMVAKINELLQARINATLTVKNISLSDYTTKYSLTIAGGNQIDLIYTSTWAFYQTEINKGAFAEITDDLRDRYMPLHQKYQNPVSWEQAVLDDKIFFVPSNASTVLGSVMGIRGDLREKYGLDPLESTDDLAAFYQAVTADPDSGVQFAYNASQNNDLSKVICFFGEYNLVQIAGPLLNYFTYQYTPDFQIDDVFWIYSSPEYLEYAKTMKEWADAGYWSKSAIANATDTREAYLNGTSASYTQNLGYVGAMSSTMLEQNPAWQPEIYDLTPDADRFFGSFVGDGYAVLENSQNKERALMAVDLIKYDKEIYNLLRHGIEGVHYETVDGKYWRVLDQSAACPFGNALSWGFKNNDYETDRVDMFPAQINIRDDWNARAIDAPTAMFAFSDINVQNELANLQSVYTQYVPLLDLGLVNDVEATLAEFQQQAENAGLAKIREEVMLQLKEYMGE